MCPTESNFHDRLAAICLKHFDTLPKTGKPKETEWTILSCIVMENNDKYEVVASGTGTKCIGTDKMSNLGTILNDSHAEVICRRAFIRFLYYNMMSESSSSIMKFDPVEQKFSVSSDYKFHLFTTHIPCGDAAIFPKDHQEEDVGHLIEQVGLDHSTNLKRKHDNDDISHKRQKQDDIFRTGAKCLDRDPIQDLKLEGSQYHVTGLVRTKPGRGIRTLSVSCSDKIAKWCHLGVQGALLSILLKHPIYLSSFTIGGGTFYSPSAIEMAFYERLGEVKLHSQYKKHKMKIGQSTLVFKHMKSNERVPCSCSIAWVKLDKSSNRQVEVAVEGHKQGATKRQIKDGTGLLKLCKLELFRTFKSVINKFNIKCDEINSLTYRQAKFLAEDYQQAWAQLKVNFKVWTMKDESLLDFRLK